MTDVNGTRICNELLKKVGPKATEIQQAGHKRERPAWTQAVKDVLKDMAGSRYECLYSFREEKLHEFLVDFTWWDKTSKRTVLACECEFGNLFQIEEDFDKLLSVKGFLKLMIFESSKLPNRATNTEQVLEALNRHLTEFGQHARGEVYMLLDLVDMSDLTRGRMWECCIKKDDYDSSLKFGEVKVDREV